MDLGGLFGRTCDLGESSARMVDIRSDAHSAETDKYNEELEFIGDTGSVCRDLFGSWRVWGHACVRFGAIEVCLEAQGDGLEPLDFVGVQTIRVGQTSFAFVDLPGDHFTGFQ